MQPKPFLTNKIPEPKISEQRRKILDQKSREKSPTKSSAKKSPAKANERKSTDSSATKTFTEDSKKPTAKANAKTSSNRAKKATKTSTKEPSTPKAKTKPLPSKSTTTTTKKALKSVSTTSTKKKNIKSETQKSKDEKTNEPPKKKKRRSGTRKKPTAPKPEPVPIPLPPPRPEEPMDPDPMKTAQDLLFKVDDALMTVESDLNNAKEFLYRYGVTYSSNPNNPLSSSLSTKATEETTTAGHSNTDHELRYTGDPVRDRIAELKRSYFQRQRQLAPENKGLNRWDKPRLPGQRRRRIVREVDMPQAPREPPTSGYSVFVLQMTCKIRHDRPNEIHHQPTVMQEIGKIWKDEMSDLDRQYYLDFAKEARTEYIRQQMEYRATGSYTKSTLFERLGKDDDESNGPWVRVDAGEMNALERELRTYKTVNFPPRPPSMDEAYQFREWKSKVNRRLKDKKIIKTLMNKEEQAIVEQAVRHAKEQYLGSALGDTTIDNAAIIAAATAEAMAKLQAFQDAQKAASMSIHEYDSQIVDIDSQDNVGNDGIDANLPSLPPLDPSLLTQSGKTTDQLLVEIEGQVYI